MTTPTDIEYRSAVDHLRSRLTDRMRAEIGAVYAFRFEDGTGATLDGRPDGAGFVESPVETLRLTADFEVTLSRHDFAELVFGRLHPMAGMATGRMRIKGPIKQAIKLDRVLKA